MPASSRDSARPSRPQNRALKDQRPRLCFEPGPLTCLNIGVSDGVRTRDPQDHNLVLYQLSYTHRAPPAIRW